MAILMVLVWHYIANPISGAGRFGERVYSCLNLMWSGVDLFFVLSGFLLGGILLDHRDSPNIFKVFYARRALRIMPLYYFVVITYFAATSGRWHESNQGLRWLFDNGFPFWIYASFTQNFLMGEVGNFGANWLGITWSLAVEEQFYLVLPLIIRWVPRERIIHALLAMIVAAPILRLTMCYWHPQAHFTGYVWMPARADALLLGVVGAWLLRHARWNAEIRNNTRPLYLLATLLLAGLIALNQTNALFSLPMTVIGQTWLALLFLCSILIATTETRGPISYLARNRMLRSIGVISYGIYMYHQIINGLAHGILSEHLPRIWDSRDALITALSLLLTILVSAASWSVFERRLVLCGHKLRYQ